MGMYFVVCLVISITLLVTRCLQFRVE